MRHLIICREYPPAPSGGIGTYAFHISRLLAEAGETVHVVGQMWDRAELRLEERCRGRLIIHRVPFDDWASWLPRQPHPLLGAREEISLFKSSYSPQCFSWQAALLAEKLVEAEGIELIEAQDYEAPLYYFQLRRALGQGPKRRPPCMVHLHSPTEFIARHNDWDVSLPSVVTAKRLEDYSIAAADELLCPSKYLARQAEIHYGLTEGIIQVIPYPIGASRTLARDNSTWERGAICYLGRLERRKGVIEWMEAAAAVGRDYPRARFEFIGADTVDSYGASIRESMERRIPKDMRAMFCFRGARKHSSLPNFLARARIAVVPSRWENFPNTCIEAMGSGLPVIASREGGMAEMIKDGQTGWLANTPDSEGLAETLKRALETPAASIAEMGSHAASDIRRLCDNQRTVEKHLELRSKLVCKGAKRSLHLPVNLPWIKRPLSDESARRSAQNDFAEGLAVVITCFNDGQALGECLESLQHQIGKPVCVVVVDDGSTDEQTLKALNQVRQAGWQVIRQSHAGLASAKNAGIQAVLDIGLNPIGFFFLCTKDRLQADFITVCESVLRRCPEVGLVSCWVRHAEADDRVRISPCPSFPYQWLANGAVPFSVVRTEALREANCFRPVMDQGCDDWGLFNAVMAAGWMAITVPGVLARYHFNQDTMPHIMSVKDPTTVGRELLERFPNLIARDAREVVLLAELAAARSLRKRVRPLWKQLANVRVMMRYPSGPSLRILGTLRSKIHRHTPVWMSTLI
jgi:glycogen(starch) synthase